MKQKVCFNDLQYFNFSFVSEKYCTNANILGWIDWILFKRTKKKDRKINKQKICSKILVRDRILNKHRNPNENKNAWHSSSNLIVYYQKDCGV